MPPSIPSDPTISVPALILAAGRSRRMGRPKALLPFHGGSLLGAHVQAAREAGLSPVVLVRAEDAIAAEARACGVRCITVGPTSTPWATLRVALLELSTPHGAVVGPVDVLPAPHTVLRSLGRPSDDDLVPVGPDDRRGHPVRLAWATCQRVRTETEPGDGLRSLLGHARIIHVAEPLSRDFDTPEDWRRATSQPI